MNTTLPLLSLAMLLGACSGSTSTPPAEATASTTAMASTTVGEQFMEAAMKEDTAKIRTLLADNVVLLGSSAQQQITSKDSVVVAFAHSDRTADSKFTPLAKGGDANMVYYSGFYTQKILPSAKATKYKQGGIDTGSYLMIAKKDSKNDWKIDYFHLAMAPLQANK